MMSVALHVSAPPLDPARQGRALQQVSRALLVAATALCAAGAQAQTAPPARPAAAVAPAYSIGPSDVLRIVVWKEPDLTQDVTVRADGMITFPLLGDVEAAGRSPARLAETLAKALQKFVESPRVTVALSQANSARFYVVGLVARPGEFPLSGHTTVLHGLALAGGLREFAKAESIVIVREDQTVIPVNYKRLAEGKDVSQNVSLARGDTIVVP
jgi:polysaccharide export outer membrane protein